MGSASPDALHFPGFYQKAGSNFLRRQRFGQALLGPSAASAKIITRQSHGGGAVSLPSSFRSGFWCDSALKVGRSILNLCSLVF